MVDQNLTIYPAVSWKGKGEVKLVLGGKNYEFYHVIPMGATLFLEHDKVFYD